MSRFFYFIFLLSVIWACNNDSICTIGEECDDGDITTENDKYNFNCECTGVSICTPGLPCNDNDNTTRFDTYDEDCNCQGTPTACTGIGDADGDGICADMDCNDENLAIVDYPGKSCNDRNPNTANDTINSDCICEGVIICASLGEPCDDGNPETYNDTINLDCECMGKDFGIFTDPRDGQEYQTFELIINTNGTSHIWLAENLNYDTSAAWCYNDDLQLCDTYGRLYDWYTAMEVCPPGWSLPKDGDYRKLVNTYGGEPFAGGHLKETGSEHWIEPNTGATNYSGFTGLPGGSGIRYGLEFSGVGTGGIWWTRTQEGAYGGIWSAIYYAIDYLSISVESTENDKYNLYSVRCVQY